jgi:hypothetical protein
VERFFLMLGSEALSLFWVEPSRTWIVVFGGMKLFGVTWALLCVVMGVDLTRECFKPNRAKKDQPDDDIMPK